MEKREKIVNHNNQQSLHSKKAAGISLSSKAQSRIQTAKMAERNIIKPSQQRRIEREKQKQKPPIPSYIKKENKKPETPKNNENLTMKSYLDDPECIQLREDIANGGSISDVETEKLTVLTAHLREYAVQCGKERNYSEAKMANSIFDFVNGELSIRKSQVVVDRSLENKFEEDRNDLIQKHKEQRDDLTQRFNEKRKKLDEKLNEETEKFEEQWRTEMPRKYRKPSSALLELIDKEDRFAKAGDFDGAAIVKKEVDALEEKEARTAQKQMIKDYKSAKRKLENKQNSERETFENKYNHQLECLIAQQKIELEQSDNRMNVINQKQIEQLKEPVKSTKIMPAHAQTHIPVAQRERILPDLIAPNDEEKIQEFERKERERSESKQSNSPDKASNKDDVELFITNAVAEPEPEENDFVNEEEEKKNEENTDDFSLSGTVKEKLEDMEA
ncbi:hypothetical protein TVAG_088180 [Trichomonas vaginalis G3]|uniref:Uncharacterized protein n=1 Tax=Trichomonas vaginalis (strain ATCC PRA-98 / G3) TaxID=412133 RepID=A2FY78_TRIV3|nr:hypothetical protein TVAGG3_0446090 [Trichomonas vaginalis G3]EAX90125.1 hypothetical protein TVAG_088180 [Trichomonas vaginalis G3]KAI5537803.1 hypothetical protein TVAGG3_0446090 [Trichomonas vaginalis G3]|eukprot:XP_001303055.1 hypothetical protein [Trichomonas vaginalis G3]